MLGPYSSGLTKAIAPVTEKYAIPMIEGNGASRSLFNKGYRYLFAVLSTSDFYLREAVNLAAEVAQLARKDPRTVKVALAIENDPFSQDIRAGVLEDAKRWKMKVVIDDKLPPELNDMSATLTKVKVLRPDLLVISGHSKGATLAIKQVSQKKINVPMLAITHCEAAKVIKNFGPLADYTLCAAQWAPPLTYKDKWFGPASDYAKRFENQSWSTPTPWRGRARSTPRRSAMRLPPPALRLSTAMSNSTQPARMSPSPWSSARFRRVSTRWWHRPGGPSQS
jgi:branched-chain amino acid transport system substrate-binding protein